jgi:deoxycytidylate deaminase
MATGTASVLADSAMKEAIAMAQRSAHKKYMMGAVIIDSRHDEVIARGWQHQGTWRMRELYSMHAELHCLFKLRHRRNDLEGCYIYIAGQARVSGNYVEALPCISCATSLMTVGINIVRYTSTKRAINGNYSILELSLPDVLDELKKYPAPYNGT